MTGRGLLVAVALTLALPSQASARDDDFVRAARMLNSWRYDDARELIAELARDHANAEETRYLRSQQAFLQGDYPGALSFLDGLDGSDIDGNVGELRALIASTYATTKDFTSRESKGGHFVLWYPPGKDEALVDLAGEVLEAAYVSLGDDFDFRPPEKVRVEILSEPADLARVSTLTEKEIETTGTIALCKYGKLMVVTPRATVFGYPWMDTLTHEYVHYVVSRTSHDTIPVWLHEGLARFQQVRWRAAATDELTPTDEHLLAEALKKGSLISFDDMHPSMAKLPSQEAAALAFAEVYTMIGYVHRAVGYDGIRKIIAAARRGVGARKAVAQALGEKWPEVERGWKKYLRGRKLKMSPALASRAAARRIRFKHGDDDSENVGIDEVKSARARKFTRLGGLLRSRGMSEAAAVEYEKALAIVGPTDPFVAGKLSRTYLELGKHQRAIELAEPLAELDPSDAAPATTLGVAYQAAGRDADARHAFEIALRVTPFDPTVRCGLAEVYGRLKETDLAKREQSACEILRL